MSARPGYYLGDHRILTLTDRGDRMYLDTRDFMITPGVLCWGGFEPETIRSFENLLRPGMRWVDIGANIGYFTIIGHKLVRDGGGQTWAFEPNPVTYTLLVDNMELNWFFEGVVTEQKAVYSESGEIHFCAPEKHSVNATIADLPDGHWARVCDRHDRITVQAVALDDYFKPDALPLDFLKIDVEGAELFVLKGARRTLAKNRDVKLLIEWSPDQMEQCGITVHDTLNEIHAQGFSCSIAEGDRRHVDLADLPKIRETTMLLLSRTA